MGYLWDIPLIPLWLGKLVILPPQKGNSPRRLPPRMLIGGAATPSFGFSDEETLVYHKVESWDNAQMAFADCLVDAGDITL